MEKIEAAYHEAGHAVVASYLGVSFDEVTLVPLAECHGGSVRVKLPEIQTWVKYKAVSGSDQYKPVETRTVKGGRIAAENCITVAFAGLFGQRLVNPEAADWHANGDFALVHDIAREYRVWPARRRAFIDDVKQHDLLQEFELEAFRLVSELKAQIETLARQLLEKQTLTHIEVQTILGKE